MYSDFDDLPSVGWQSVGLHPWYLKSEYANALPLNLIRAAHFRNVLAIGECGLDNRCDTPKDLQRRVFIAQVELAKQIRKPLIIHCVRAFDELLSILGKYQVSVPVIFHGFRHSTMLAEKIMDQGYLLSFGRHLLMPSVAEVFRKLPADRVFLESDDSDVKIDDIYLAAAAIRRVDVESLSTDIGILFKQIFGPVTDLI
jgi:TatD DNase family protein